MDIGERLRGEREARNVPIEAIAAATGIARRNLDALEHNAFNALPGRAKFYIRAYAKTLGFDPRRMIDEYDRELEAAQHPPAAAPEPERAAPRPVEAAIARWRKAAMEAHSAPATTAADDFEDDEDLDEELDDDRDEAAPPAVTLPLAGTRAPGPQSMDDSEDDSDLAAGARASGPQSMDNSENDFELAAGTRASGPQSEDDSELAAGTPATGPQSENDFELAAGTRASGPQSEDDFDLAAGTRASGPQSENDFELAAGTRASGPQSEDGLGPSTSIDVRTRGPRTHVALDPGRPIATTLRPPSLARIAASVLIGIAIVFVGIRLVFFKTNADGGGPASVAAAPAIPSPVPPPSRSEPDPEQAPPEIPKRTVAPLPLEKPAVKPAPAGALSVIASGVGRRIVNHRLAETADTFAPGDAVWFSTRVTGGKAGEGIRHVWIHAGRPQQSIPLRLGGPDYHIHSRKTVYYEGPWTVEARDSQGDVLARASFECIRPH